jgi:hypothetical protein
MNTNPWYPLLTGAAITISLIALYLQHLRIRGPKLRFMEDDARTGSSDNTPQISTILPYATLPVEIRNRYPDYREEGDCALLAIPVVNEGDRSGYMKVLTADADSGVYNRNERERIRFSFYTYLAVPAFSAELHTMLIRNLPRKDNRHGILTVKVKYQFTSFSWRKRLCYRTEEKYIQVELQPPNPELSKESEFVEQPKGFANGQFPGDHQGRNMPVSITLEDRQLTHQPVAREPAEQRAPRAAIAKTQEGL